MNNFHKSHLQPWGLELVNKYPLIFLEADPHNAPWAHSAGVKEEDYVNLRYGFECKEGWKKHIETIAQRGAELVCHLRSVGLKDEDAYIHSCIVKEKFGGLRWQGCSKMPPLFEELWRTFYTYEENQSYWTCEVTGKHGELRKVKNGIGGVWVQTLCTEEAIKQGYDLTDYEKEQIEREKNPQPEAKSVRVAIIESERGWGRKLEDVKTFPTMEAAQAFIKEYNSYNTATTAPDWYMQAELMDEINYG